MNDKLFEKLLNVVLKSVVAVLAGSGLNQLSGGTVVGRAVLDSYSSAIGVDFVNLNMIPDTVHADWSREILYGSLQHTFGVPSLMVLLALVLLICHVEYRAGATADGPAPVSPAGAFYRKHYFPITVGLYLALFGVYLSIHSQFGLIAFFLLISISAGWYLFRYGRDLADALMRTRITYLALAAIFIFVFVALPIRYGRYCFDIFVRPVVSEVTNSNPKYPSVGVCLDERSETVGRIYFTEQSRLFAVEKHAGEISCSSTLESLREIAVASAEPIALSDEAVSEAKEMAAAAGLF